MSDRYLDLVNHPIGRNVAKRLNLPSPSPLRRYAVGQPLVDGAVLVGAAPDGRLLDTVTKVLSNAGADVRTDHDAPGAPPTRYAALVFDATGIVSSAQLDGLYAFFHPVVRKLGACGRVLVLGTPPEDCKHPGNAVAQRAIEGFVRSLAKEVREGATANLAYVAEGGQVVLESTLRFLLSAKSAYVSGQVVRVGTPGRGDRTPPDNWDRPLDGKVAVVTGAARGIGEAISATLTRDGAHVVCVDVPAAGDALAGVANRLDGEALALDITAENAPSVLVDRLRERHGGVDVVVHNAGITRDKTLARMSEDHWNAVLSVNLTAQERLTTALVDEDVLRKRGRIVCVSSVGGIAGNRGQTNYATSKAGVVGLVQALAPTIRSRPATANAVAPGFIETTMTAAMPTVPREFGRRLASLGQGGQPVDVAEAVAWLAAPGTGGVSGSVLRVCGQSLIGA